MTVRRVVAGLDSEGRSVIVSDGNVAVVNQGLMPGVTFHRLWLAEERPSVPNDGSPPTVESDLVPYMPPPGGFRFDICTIPPAPAIPSPMPSAEEVAALLAEVAEATPWVLTRVHVDPENPHMHSTDTIDFDVVLSGEVTLELEGGAMVDLKPGDTVVLNGVKHHWHNRMSEPAVMAIALIGTDRR